jgi:arginyl-tRNA synthetase
LKKNRETDVIFDWDEFMSFEWNSGPYIQYAYVRSVRILEKFSWSLDVNNVWSFELKEEISLVKAISNYNEILEKTAKTNMPHHLCNYIYDLTKAFNSFYNSIHILNEENEDKKMIRLKLISLFWKILKDWFAILGIEMPEKM